MNVWFVILMVAAPAQSTEDAAQESAERWRELVDSGRYDDSWDEAASLVKGAVTKEDWGRSMAALAIRSGVSYLAR